MKNRHWLIGTLAVFLLLPHGTWLMAEDWTVPSDQKEQVAPFLFTPGSVEKGADLFLKNCQSCHGNPTRADFARMDPSPGDPASGKFRELSDGEMFYKISNGRGAMPQFKLILSEEDRWSLVSYLRSFHPGYIQPDLPAQPAGGMGERGIIELTSDSVSKNITVRVFLQREGSQDPLPGAGVHFYVKRFFGNLPLGDQVRTGADGKAHFRFPEGIPGDSTGFVNLVAQLNESGGYGGAKKEIRVRFGDPARWIPLTEGRTMWNINAKAPIWLMLVYSLTVLGVFITLIYIMLQIRRIFYLGTEARKNFTANPDIDQNPKI